MTTFSLSPVETSSTALDELSAITSALAKSKAQIVLVGAGISTSAGIQDFRSPTGLYSNALPSTSRISPASFSSSVYSSPSTRSAHWKLIANLQEQSAASTPTKTHLFFNTLKSRGTLRRVYSQNIDGLEGKAGLAKVRVQGSVESGFSGGSDMGAKGKGKAKWEGEYVALHGDVHLCRCTGCAYVGRWDSKISEAFSRGETLDCPDCLEMAQLRILSQKRSPPLLTFLRPSIILYDESPPHSAPTTIAQVAQSDLNSKPDFVLVMGTSLKIPGFKDLVKQFAREVKSRGGIAVFVNGEKVAGKEWESVFDYQVVGKTDDFVDLVLADWKSTRPRDWTTQSKLDTTFISTKSTSVHSNSKSRFNPSFAPAPIPKSPLQQLTPLRLPLHHLQTTNIPSPQLQAKKRSLPSPFSPPSPSPSSAMLSSNRDSDSSKKRRVTPVVKIAKRTFAVVVPRRRSGINK